MENFYTLFEIEVLQKFIIKCVKKLNKATPSFEAITKFETSNYN